MGVSLGLLVSVYTVSRRNHQRTLAEATVVHETLVHKITQQVSSRIYAPIGLMLVDSEEAHCLTVSLDSIRYLTHTCIKLQSSKQAPNSNLLPLQEARLLDEAKLRKETERDSEKQQVPFLRRVARSVSC